jgi:small subunit ribosomal protein S9
VPYSPSYFSRSPFFNDHLVYINTLLTKYEHLPTLPPEKMPKIAWKGRESFAAAGEHIPAKQYAYAMHIAKRLSQIHPSIVPTEVTDALLTFKRDFDPNVARVKVIPVDHLGRAVGVGRRKRSSARAWVIEGTGEVIVNGKPLCEAFARIHDRESAIWALRVTERMDKYNVYALVEGGGTTGQAEAVAMAVAMGMMGHEPDLKPALRRGKTPSITATQIDVRHSDTASPPQPAVSPETREKSRGKSLAVSRPARSLHGTPVKTLHIVCVAGKGGAGTSVDLLMDMGEGPEACRYIVRQTYTLRLPHTSCR